MDFTFLVGILPSLWSGFWITVTLWLGALCLGLIGATSLAVMRASDTLLVEWFARGFITAVRGTPLLAQVYILYYGVGNLLARVPAVRFSAMWPILRDGYVYALAALAISFTAYAGEILRGGIAAVPRGEVEAARALGLRPWMIWLLIIIPRAFRISLPALGGQNIILLKSTVLASTITVMDLLGTANYIRIQTFRTYEPLLAVTVIFVILTWLSARCVFVLERRYSFGAH
jgi:polar amino acid transport system permease protein